MPGFDSNNFKKNIPSNQKPMREFTVGAPEEGEVRQYSFGPNAQTGSSAQAPAQSYAQQPEFSPAEIEEQIKEARRQKLAPNRIGDEAKKRVEILANIGRLTKDVNIGGFSFTLRTLKAKETKEAALATFSTSITQLEASYEARKQQLARSIFKIDGEDIEVILGSRNLNDVMSFIEDQLEDVVVEKLWNDYVALKDEARVKYGITTNKDAQEVAEDLKK